jgi:hypothetical protein
MGPPISVVTGSEDAVAAGASIAGVSNMGMSIETLGSILAGSADAVAGSAEATSGVAGVSIAGASVGLSDVAALISVEVFLRLAMGDGSRSERFTNR